MKSEGRADFTARNYKLYDLSYLQKIQTAKIYNCRKILRLFAPLSTFFTSEVLDVPYGSCRLWRPLKSLFTFETIIDTSHLPTWKWLGWMLSFIYLHSPTASERGPTEDTCCYCPFLFRATDGSLIYFLQLCKTFRIEQYFDF